MLKGERRRDFVITPDEEARYLNAAPEPLGSIAAVLSETGLRPEECYRLRWESISWSAGPEGTLLVTHGKTAAARRVVYMTPSVREILEGHWENPSCPREGWVWPAPTRSGHVEASSLKKQHQKTFKLVNDAAAAAGLQPIRQFVLYSFRHTFLTRVGESAHVSVWALGRLAGHSSPTITQRYVHPSDEAVLRVMSRVGGHRSGHTKTPALPSAEESALQLIAK
jgi:integrase